MNLRSKKSSANNLRRLTIYLNPTLSQAVDQWMVSLDLDSRETAARVIMTTGISALPMDSAVFEACRSAMWNMRKYEFAEMAKYFDERKALYKVGQ